MALGLRAGVPVQDIEMWQFHLTGIAAQALVTEVPERVIPHHKDGEHP